MRMGDRFCGILYSWCKGPSTADGNEISKIAGVLVQIRKHILSASQLVTD